MKKYLLIAATGFMAMTFQSCLKDKGFEDGRYGTPGTTSAAVSFSQGSNDTTAITSAVGPSTGAQAFTQVQIALEGTPPLDHDVTVTIASNPGLVTGSGLTAFPAGTLTLPTTVVIPKGKQVVTVPITVTNSSSLSLTTSYGIGLSITGVSDGLGIVNNRRDVVVQVNVQNQYDGVYAVVSGLVTRYSSPGVVEPASTLNGPLGGNPNVILTTTGPNSVSIPVSGQVGALYWKFGSNSQVAGIDGLTVTVNPATNATTITSATNPSLANWAGHVNSYDPATRTFHLSFNWTPVGATSFREYEIVLTYDHAR